jgi:DNA-directed RNA polymerase specialized sigma24 family protein
MGHQEKHAEGSAVGGVPGGLFRHHYDVLIRFLMVRLHARQQTREVAHEPSLRLPQLKRLEAVADEDQRLSLVGAFLDELPDAVRDALLMFRVRDLDQETIAQRLGVTERVVRNHITRALMYCRLRLDGLCAADALKKLNEGIAR